MEQDVSSINTCFISLSKAMSDASESGLGVIEIAYSYSRYLTIEATVCVGGYVIEHSPLHSTNLKNFRYY